MEYPPTSEIMAELRRLESEINIAIDELEKMLRGRRKMTENDKLQMFENQPIQDSVGPKQGGVVLFPWWMWLPR